MSQRSCLFAGLVIATALVVSSCSRPNEDAEVNASVQRLVAAVNAKDINGIMAYYTPDDSLLVFDAMIPRQYVGAAAFRIVARYYGTDQIPFTFVSDELNGVTTDSQRQVRPYRPRSFDTLGQAALENARSRIYLGIHWQFDAVEGIAQGNRVATYVLDNLYKPASK